ncbi:Zinc finger- C3HC4 type (RING finger) family protein [Striga hermonthica]|uniref:RING-type E3 ubiquitin transferase n=1 Tax=Striga hermonthica TaxID=68872 RepID=A0A9N7MJD0_STRHE|nr:Zinc finger- C3HC4 type (RING finger) family protein [Striga hermonthica]
MNQDYQRLPLTGGSGGDGDVGTTTNSISESLSYPFAKAPASSGRGAVSIDVAPEDYGSDGEDEIPAAPLAGDCGYSRPFLFLDMIWNLAFVAVSIFVLLVTVRERPATPLRLWVIGYALQCLLHVGFVWDEYQSRGLDGEEDGGGRRGRNFHSRGVSILSALSHKSVIKKLESVNTIVSSVWWVFGFYWIVIGGQPLLQDSPRLYWLSVIFLAFDVFFMIFCIAMACVIFLLLFCCFPILATVAYAMTIRDGASENDIKSLPKYVYRQKNILEDEVKQEEVNLTALPGNSSSTSELFLNPEDSECCICLYKYVNGAELCTLPCNHHFHHKCITKWLRINATCPLCKFNILRGDMMV